MLEFLLPKELKNKRVSFSSRDIEPQEIFLDALAKKREEEFGISEKKLEVPLPKIVLQILLFLSLAVFLFLFGKTLQFQVFENKKYIALAEENKYVFKSLKSGRGVIYDSFGKQIVFNKTSFNLIFKKSNYTGEESTIATVASIIGKNQDELKSIVDKSKTDGSAIIISEALDHDKLILLESKISDLKGFEIEKSAERDYRDGAHFSSIIGYIGKRGPNDKVEDLNNSNSDYIGKTGIEKTYEDILKRSPGQIKIERDALGKEKSKSIIALPESGKSLMLWLDSDLQVKIYDELSKITSQIGAKKAAAIAMDPKTGGILSLVSLPSFDNNLFVAGADQKDLQTLLNNPDQPLFNRTINGKYATGSTIKPILATAALEEKIITPEKKIIDDKGEIVLTSRYGPPFIFHDWRVHDWADMRKALAESCDVYFYTIGGGYGSQPGLGPTRIKKYLELFGWGSKTGIDLPGENPGFIPSIEWRKQKGQGWWDGDTYNISIGQGDLGITPMQVAASYVAIANGGTLYKPEIVKAVVDDNKNIVEEIKPSVIRTDFVNPDNLKVAREGMRQAVTGDGSPYASSITLKSLPVAVAAKTGTAETSMPNVYHNWIALFAPYDNPQIVLTIMIEDVKNVQAAALPVAKEVLNWYFSK